ncbi:hypothetical protein LO80_04270 [Candidatus Francisella endociliophora]|uniref:Uncharacterized protein n=1 Tax=Candidatus Francisella endociliophora TaxID=653937 RepID=A0A097ENX2_9GAMM|nr:hypothetical protein [Francisella sp. FSC1006]AIT09259.1 hypothetical protein LO80_04270 [Francisella sp. FSC1006]
MFSNDYTVALIGEVPESIRQQLDCQIASFPNMQENEIHLSYNGIDAVIVTADDEKSLVRIVSDIRSNVDTYLLPVFCIDNEYEKYVDKKYTDFKSLKEYISLTKHEFMPLESQEHLKTRAQREWRFRLLTYLFTRKIHNQSLNVFIDKETFRYPLIEIFSEEKNHSLDWLTELESSNFIEVKNQSYKEVLKEGSLEEIKICDYQITDQAEHFIRTNVDYALSVFDNINYVIPDFFYTLLEWNSNMQYRNKEFYFSLIHITFLKDWDVKQIDDLAKGVKNILRKTDLLTRVSEKDIWIWLPNTSKENSIIVLDRIKNIKISKNIYDEDIHASDIAKIKSFFSIDLGKIDNAEQKIKEISFN